MNTRQVNGLMLRCVTVVTLSASILFSASIAAVADSGSPDHAAVVDLFQKFEACINQREVEGLAELLSDRDTEWKQEVVGQYHRFWERTPNFRCRFEIGQGTCEGDDIKVPALRIVEVFENDKIYGDVSWRMISLESNDESSWRILKDLPFETARAASTDINMRLDMKNGSISARAALSVENLSSGFGQLLLALNSGLTVQSVIQPNGTPLGFRRIDGCLIVELNQELVSVSTIEVIIEYTGDFGRELGPDGCRQSWIGEPVSFATWTDNWYPRLLQGSSKTCGKLTFDVPVGVTVISNGTLVSDQDYGRRTRRVFEVDTPVNYSFAAGDYTERSKWRDGKEFSVSLLERDRGHSRDLLKAVTRIVRHLSDLYGDYPFQYLKIVEIPGSILGSIGGSSEQGMIFVPETMIDGDYFNLAVISHEIGHVWWGNAIRSLDGKVINEGLAQLSALLCIEHLQGESAMRAFQRSGFPGFPQSAQYYFLVTADRVGRDVMLGDAFYAHSREMHSIAETKAAFIYLMLRDYIGEVPFYKGLKRIVSEFSGRCIDLNDLKFAWSRESGIDLTGFFDQWFFRTGAPEFSLEWSARRAREGWLITCQIDQLRDFYAVRAEIEIQGTEESIRRSFTISTSPSIVQFTAPFEPEKVLFDPNYRILRWTPQHIENLALGSALLLQSEHCDTEATDSYEAFLASHPTHSFGHLYYGNFLFLTHQYESAIRHYQLAVDHAETDPDFLPFTAIALLRIGQANESLDRIKEAVTHYEEIFKRQDIAGAHQLARKSLRDLFARNDPTVIEKQTPDLRNLWRQVYYFGM